jgi:hypothetical protein
MKLIGLMLPVEVVGQEGWGMVAFKKKKIPVLNNFFN